MSAAMSTILVLGGTGGIGLSFARRWHAAGKRVIITGRRSDRLSSLKAEIPGFETYIMDNSDFAALPGHIATLLEKYPDIDTVWVNGGIQHNLSFKEAEKWSDEKIIQELNINTIGPILVAKHVMPHLLSLKRTATFMITSSGIAFVPISAFPVYGATKAGVHHFMVALRDQMHGSNVGVVEIAPPYVETELDKGHREAVGSGMKAMPLSEYTDEVFKVLDEAEVGELKEVGVGFASMGVEKWRGAFGGVLEHIGSKG